MKFKVLVINLDKDKERLEYISRELSEAGLEFERLPAVLGREYDGDEYKEELAIAKNGKSLHPGEVGCALSHKRAQENFLNSDFDYALILEDDVSISKNFKDVIEKEIERNEKYKNKTGLYFWEYLQFDYWAPFVFWTKIWPDQIIYTFKIKKGIKNKIIFILKTFLKIPLALLFSVYEILVFKLKVGPINFYRDIYLAGAYLINKGAAEKLLSLSELIVYPADRVQNEAKKKKGLKIKYYSPVLVYQGKGIFGSSILDVGPEDFVVYNKYIPKDKK